MPKNAVKNRYGILTIIAIVSILSFIFSAQRVEAAVLFLSPASNNVTTGNIVTVRVLVDTSGKYINTADAIVQFPADLLEVLSVSKNSSIFSLWVEDPKFVNGNGTISFNGGVPNPGYKGLAGEIISVTFKAKKSGNASIVFGDSSVRENDGFGTNVLSVASPASVKITTPPPLEPVPEPTPPVPVVPKPTPKEEPKEIPIEIEPVVIPIAEEVIPEPVHVEIVKATPSQSLTFLFESLIPFLVSSLSVIIPLLVLLFALIYIIYFGWHKFFGLHRKINEDLNQTIQETHKVLDMFKDELDKQLEILENTKKDRLLNRKEKKVFKELKNNVDTIDNFIENKLKKLK